MAMASDGMEDVAGLEKELEIRFGHLSQRGRGSRLGSTEEDVTGNILRRLTWRKR